jgi:two-component sensor histidine kinase
VVDHLEGIDQDVRDTAALLVSELATNSVRHAATAFTVSVAIGTTHIRISVTDHDPTIPSPQTASVRAVSGRGLALVARLAVEWGIEPMGDGKRVWFVLALG